MGSNIIELAKFGHERAAELKASCGAVDVRSLAQLISDLATQLEVQLVRGNAQAVQLANAESKCRELAAENAGLKALARGWANATDDRLFEEHGEIFHDSIDACEEELKTICPATDAFLDEVRASALEYYANLFKGTVNMDVKHNQEFHKGTLYVADQIRKGSAL